MTTSQSLKLSVLAFILLLNSCTTMNMDSMLQTTSITTNTPFMERATAIYDVASECWNPETYALYNGTEIEKEFTEESATIIAHWKPTAEKSSAPVIKIMITPKNEGSVARIYEREHPLITRGDYEIDAQRWLNGLYSCI